MTSGVPYRATARGRAGFGQPEVTMTDRSEASGLAARGTSALFRYVPHPHIAARRGQPPATTSDERVGVNGKIGVFITTIVGTMWAAYLFTALALVSMPSAVKSHDKIIIVAWIAQTFLQLVLLPIIIVGQNVQARAADKRSQQTYHDAEAILHECLELQAHLQAQDRVLGDLLARPGRTGAAGQ
jgi:hypothetical protein